MRWHVWRLLRMLVVGVVLSLPFGGSVSAQKPWKHVLVLNSYHQGLSWTDEIVAGIRTILPGERDDIEVWIEYMDTKRVAGDLYFQQLAAFYQEKFAAHVPDVIIASDNDALNFLVAYRDAIFPQIPVVFCGINAFAETMLAGHTAFTGVTENPEVKATLDLAVQQHPHAKRLVIINDVTTTGVVLQRVIDELLPAYKERMDVIVYHQNIRMDELLTVLAQLPPDSIVFVGLFNRDAQGAFFSFEQSMELISGQTQAPVYGCWNFYLGHGVVGGKMIRGFTQGETAAKMAFQILNGAAADTLPILLDSPGHYMFDDVQLKRFALSNAQVPAGSLVINQPISWYEQRKTWILSTLGLAGLASVLAIIVHLRTAALRRAVDRQIQANRALQAARDELAQQTYILDTFLANVPDFIYFKDRESRFIRSNQAHARLLGFDNPVELVGKSDFDFYPAEQVQPRHAQEQEILRTGQPLVNFEEPNVGGAWTLTTKMPLRDEHGAIIGTFGISRDITELKRAQQALAQAYSEISVLNTELQEENVRMGAELDVVRQLQHMILPRPQELTNIPGLEIVGYMQPADEVGGDYYDVLHQDGVLHIGIGDVTGHGLESGVIMLMTQSAIRTLIEHGETDPVKFVTTLNRLIYKNVKRMDSDKNLTFALVQYQGGQFKLVGQHEEALVIRQGGRVERVDTMGLGFPVGLEPEIHDWVHAATMTLNRGEALVLYTDGVTEAENAAQELYGIDRLCAVLGQQWEHSAEAIKQAVVDDLRRHIGAQNVYDDITLVVLKQQ